MASAACIGGDTNHRTVVAFDIAFFALFLDRAGQGGSGRFAGVVLTRLSVWTGAIGGARAAMFAFVGLAFSISAGLGGDGLASVVLTRLAAWTGAIGEARAAVFAFVSFACSVATRACGNTSTCLTIEAVLTSAIGGASGAVFAFVGLAGLVAAIEGGAGTHALPCKGVDVAAFAALWAGNLCTATAIKAVRALDDTTSA